MEENQNIDKKSLKLFTGSKIAWNDLAKDCVCFANAKGGVIFIGIEDKEILPPKKQTIPPELSAKIQKRISELTINVGTQCEIKIAENGAQFIALNVLPSISTIASTTDGRYYIRISDTCNPVLPDELNRLFSDKSAYNWESKISKTVKRKDADSEKLKQFVNDILSSERTTSFVKQKSEDELLDYYLMADGDYLTNLGILWVGKRTDRAKLLFAPVVQFLKYDENDKRVNKIIWDDFYLNPKELIEAVWTQIPDWKEGIEISDGLFRKFIFNYEEDIIRELMANALVHRPYTTRGDIFINMYTDRLEVHNPGLFPLGVTPHNILHQTVKRNEHLAKVFYDLNLMEREGSGFDRMYEILLANGKPVPEPSEGNDRVTVVIRKQILKDEIVKLISRANEEYQLKQKEIICLGLIAQHTTLSSIEFSNILGFQRQNTIQEWLGRLMNIGLIKTKGKTKGVEYYINPGFLRASRYKGKTDLKNIEPHRLKALIYQDVSTYPNSSISEIHQRIGTEIAFRKLRTQLYLMVKSGEFIYSGERKGRRYFIDKKL